MSTSTMLRPMGSTAKPMNTATTSTTGARKCTTASALSGTMSSLVSDLMPSAIGCKNAIRARRDWGRGDSACGPVPCARDTVVSANSAGKHADDGDHAEQHARQRSASPAGRKPTSQCLSRTKIWSSLLDHRLRLSFSRLGAAGSAGLRELAMQALRRGSGSGCLGGRSFGCSFGLGFRLGLFLGQARIHFRRFGGMNLVVVLVRLGQLLAVAAAGRRSDRRWPAQTRVSILIASNGQTSTQIWQLMQTEISMSKLRRINLRLAHDSPASCPCSSRCRCTWAGTLSRRSGRPRSACPLSQSAPS